MPSVYDKDAYSQRVNYAAQCFLRGTDSRHFDTCFEMYDGAAVVTALVRRAEKNPRLHSAIAAQWREGFPQSWKDTAAQFAAVPTRRLVDLAALFRANDGARTGNHVDAFLAQFSQHHATATLAQPSLL
ncbi:MAG: hypothetical protein F8N36_13715 [Desulfovibrio sp.]|uniref:hypothetical protein n=1 Tax=Desulfovibrio sp. TaxID=885 RepID=UPI00135E68FA|nr:hypothetical protein [Desulfovibrio sp.]MTJ93896.1 hypothetical protein [Desulfovibrio sp.]